MKRTHWGPYLLSLWGPCGLEGGIRITYCTGSWPCVCPCERVLCFFVVFFCLFCSVVRRGGGGGLKGSTNYSQLSGDMQMCYRPQLPDVYLCSQKRPRVLAGEEVVPLFLCEYTVGEFQQGECFNSFAFLVCFFLTFYQTWKTFFSVQTFWNCIKAHASLSTFPLKKNKSIELEWSGLKGEWVLVLLHRALPLFSWSWTHRVLIPSISH